MILVSSSRAKSQRHPCRTSRDERYSLLQAVSPDVFHWTANLNGIDLERTELRMRHNQQTEFMTSKAHNSFLASADSNAASQRAATPDMVNESDTTFSLDEKNEKQLARILRNSSLKQWDNSAADLQLTPVSCVEVYRELVVQGKSLALLSNESTEEETSRIGSKPAGSLITRHPDHKLALRCRKLEMETSANNPAIKYTLYLAAGFAVTVNPEGHKKRAPVLLIPVSIARSRGRGSAYVIRYEGEPLRLNPHIAESCASHVDQIVKPFESAADLRDYLRSMRRKLHSSLQCKISANTGLFSLQSEVLSDITPGGQIDLELERTRPGTAFQPLPPTPEQFNAQLAIRMLRFIDQNDLSHALDNFSGIKSSPNATSVLEREPTLDGETLEKTLKCAQWLADVGLGHWRLQHIFALPERIKKMAGDIETLRNLPEFGRHFANEFETIGLLVNLYKAQSRIKNAPPEMQHHAISLHADADTRLLLQKAKIQATTIEQEIEQAKETFHMNAVPNSSALSRLIKTIAKREQSSQLTNPAYFRARRQLNEILKTCNGLVTEGDLERLNSLARTLKFSELFEEDVYYKRCFGSLFNGVSTNWQRLDSVVNFARNLSYDLDSAQLVGRLTEHWPSFQRDFENLSDPLRPAAMSAHKLSTLIPMFISTDTRLSHAVRTANKFHDKVNQWQRYLQKNVQDTSLTPYAMLQQPHADAMGSPDVSLAQREYDDRIYHHIVGKGLSRETVAATSDWLRVSIERLEIDVPAIRRFLDSESKFDANENTNNL